MLSSGVKNLAKLVGGWTVAIGLVAVTAANFEEIRARLGLRLTPEDFGVAGRASGAPQAPEPEVRTIVRYVERDPLPKMDGRSRNHSRSARDEDLFRSTVSLERGSDGHFRTSAEINGRSIGVLVDTGATLVAMSYEDAATAGISVGSGDFRYVSNTANGQARFARVTLDQVRIGNVVVRNVPAAVSEPGRLGITLLGMSFLGQLRMEMKNGRLILEQ
jgi:aspartyl protease family protein